jgi:hypothetical protein
MAVTVHATDLKIWQIDVGRTLVSVARFMDFISIVVEAPLPGSMNSSKDGMTVIVILVKVILHGNKIIIVGPIRV